MLRLPKWFIMLFALVLVLGLATPALAEHQATSATIKNVSADQNLLVVTDKDGKDWTFQVTDNPAIFMAGEENAKPKDLKAGQDVGILFEKKDDRLVANAVVVHEGEFKSCGLAFGKISRASADDNTITATDDAGKEATYQMADKARLRLNDKATKLNDVKAGDTAIIVWEKKGDKFMVKAIDFNRR